MGGETAKALGLSGATQDPDKVEGRPGAQHLATKDRRAGEAAGDLTLAHDSRGLRATALLEDRK